MGSCFTTPSTESPPPSYGQCMAEDKVVSFLNAYPDIKRWFLGYSPVTYDFRKYPQLDLIASVADGEYDDFDQLCRNVRMRLLKNECVTTPRAFTLPKKHTKLPRLPLPTYYGSTDVQ